MSVGGHARRLAGAKNAERNIEGATMLLITDLVIYLVLAAMAVAVFFVDRNVPACRFRRVFRVSPGDGNRKEVLLLVHQELLFRYDVLRAAEKIEKGFPGERHAVRRVKNAKRKWDDAFYLAGWFHFMPSSVHVFPRGSQTC